MSEKRISRRDVMQGGLAAGAAIVGSRALARDTKDATRRPNILLIFSDQQHWQAMGCVDPFFDTPNLDALAKDACLFEHSFCTTPQCSPSRSSLLTGLYPSKTGVMGNTGAAGGKALARETIGARLQAAGYRTGYFGKWHLGNKAVATTGWDQSRLKISDRRSEADAVAFLKKAGQSDKPFALFVSFNNPHDIYKFKTHTVRPAGRKIALPPSWDGETFKGKPSVQKQFMLEDQGTAIWGKGRSEWEKYRDCYRAKTKLYDSNVGVVLGELKQQGLWDSTIVIVTSDHGDMDANHKLIFKGPFMYEHMVRVPLLIRVPKRLGGAAPRRIADVDAVNVDIAPTIGDFCGLAPTRSDGVSLKPVLTGAKGQVAREFVIGQYYSKQRWVNPIRMIRTRAFKFNRTIGFGDELYDLKNDPHELRNLASDAKYAAVKKRLAAQLDKWITDNGDTFYSFKPTTRSGRPIG